MNPTLYNNSSYLKKVKMSPQKFNKIVEFINETCETEYKLRVGSKKGILTDHKYNPDYYTYIPFSFYNFVDICEDILQKTQFKFTNFVDVGCGIGDKILWFKKLCEFANVSGVEYNKNLCESAQKFLKKNNVSANIINDDAFNIDYSKYNFIYMYVPIMNDTIMQKLWLKVLLEMKEGIFIDVGVFPPPLYSYIFFETSKDFSFWDGTYIIKKNNIFSIPILNLKTKKYENLNIDTQTLEMLWDKYTRKD